MSVFTKEAFQMSSLPPSRPGSGAATPAEPQQQQEQQKEDTEGKSSSNVVEIDVEACLFDVSVAVYLFSFLFQNTSSFVCRIFLGGAP